MTITSGIQSSANTISPEDLKNIEMLNKVIAASGNKGTNPAVQHAALGVIFAKYKEKQDEALTHLGKAIEHDPENSKIAFAYSRRGALYRVMGLWDKALEDLTKAQTFLTISATEKAKIEDELRLVHERLNQGEDPPQASFIPKMRSGFIPSTIGEGEQQAGGDMVNYFVSFLNFVEGEEAAAPSVGTNEREKIYWNAFALCRVALQRENENAEDPEIESLYRSAQEHLNLLIEDYTVRKQRVPSVIWYMSAVVNFKRGFHEDSHNHICSAIEGNPSDEKYYRIRKLIRLELGLDVLAEQDDIYLRELKVPPEDVQEAIHILNELTHLIEYYAQVKTDQNTYFRVIHEFCSRKMIKVSRHEFQNLTVEKMQILFQEVGIFLSPAPSSIHSGITQSVYDALGEKGVAMEPGRGETLPPIEVLYLRRSMILSFLAKKLEDKEKLAQAMEDVTKVVELTAENQPELAAQALIGRAIVAQHYQEYEDALFDLVRAQKMVPDHPQMQLQIAQLISVSQPGAISPSIKRKN